MEWKKGNYNRALLILFAVYLAALTWIILFKLTVPSNIWVLGRDRVINLIPFYDTIENKFFNDFFDMTANIIVFIPFGIYAGVILRGVPMWQKAMTAAVLSAGYEAAQFIFAIGVTDITDVMMNTLGAVIGAAVYEYIYLKLKSDQKTRRFIALCSAASAIPMGAVLGITSVAFSFV